MATTNYNLPTITGNMTADVVRDMNALAEATDEAIKEAVDGVDLSTVTQQIGAVDQRVTTHLAENATLTTKGHVQLSSATNSTSEVLAATPKAVKSMNDSFAAHVTGVVNYSKYALSGSQSVPSTQYTTIAFNTPVETSPAVSLANLPGYFIINEKGTYRVTTNVYVDRVSSAIELRIISNNGSILAMSKTSESLAPDSKTATITSVIKCDRNFVLNVDFAHYESNNISISKAISHITIEKLGGLA